MEPLSFLPTKEELQHKLMSILGERDLTYQDIANEVGISVGAIWAFMRTSKPYRFKTLFKLNKYVHQQDMTKE